jgi:hypothetical protein
MTTIEDLARTLADKHGIESVPAVRDGVSALVDQIADDPDLWDADTNQLTPAGAEMIADAYNPEIVSTAAGNLLADIETENAEIARAEAAIADRIVERDRLIRAAMQTELPREAIAAAAGLKVARLYQIRDGRR